MSGYIFSARRARSKSKSGAKIITNPSMDDFDLLRVLGRGGFSKVFLVKTKGSENLFAMKVFSKAMTIKRRQVEHTLSEFTVLRDSEHPFICQLHYAFESEKRLFLVSELCPGGELFYYLQTNKYFFSSKAVRFYTGEIILAIEYLHLKNIVHRDVKPENVMFDGLGHVRLIDFGLCKENITGAEQARTFCGTPAYMAPEMYYSKIKGKGHGKAIDWWGLGILIYELLYGWPPFYDKNGKDMIRKVLEEEPKFPKVLREMPHEAMDIVKALLIKNPEERLGISGNGIRDLKAHPFVAVTKWKQLLQKKLKPPFKPKVKVIMDNFDTKFTDEEVRFSESEGHIDEHDEDIFHQFNYSRDVSQAALSLASMGSTKSMLFKRKVHKKTLVEQPVSKVQEVMIDKKTKRLLAQFDAEDVEYHKATVSLEDFNIVKWLGKGSFSKVFLVQPIKSEEKTFFAMKIFSKKEIIEKKQIEHTNAEYSILRRMNHPFICHLYHAFETESTICLISEFCEGGELYFHLKKKGFFFDEEARFLVGELFLALNFLHLKNIMYRDLKAENVMFDTEGHIRLIDFGCSKVNVTSLQQSKTICGTPAYFAPEMILGRDYELGHGKPIDWWAFGILMYELYFGETPFYDDNQAKMFENILKPKVKFPLEKNVLPPAGQDMILEFLKEKPEERLGIVSPGVRKLIGHKYFEDTDFEKLSAKKVKPPFVPKMAGKTGHFDKAITAQAARLSEYEIHDEGDMTFLEFSFSRQD